VADASPFIRLFTIDEANRLLPTMRDLMTRVLDRVAELRAKSEEVIRARGLSPQSSGLMKRLQENEEVSRLIEEVKRLVEEIQSHGCLCKGVEEGLIDFPCLFGDEVVFLCWRYGEETVAHWHRIEDGFAGRRSLLDEDDGKSGGEISYH
jgi:hypothetical protein